jgi:cell division protein FtsW (lipid II flippase)
MIVEVVGFIGVVLVLSAYILITTEKVTAKNKIYHILNGVGSLGILINAFYHTAIPSVLLNGIFLFVAGYGFIKARKG